MEDRPLQTSATVTAATIPKTYNEASAAPATDHAAEISCWGKASRVIENERDRLTTILVAPLLTCSARLPVYALLIAAFVPQTTYLGGMVGLQGLTLASLYVLGIVAAVTVALVLKRTILHGATPPFVMEMPSYKWPSPRTVAMRVMDRAWIFLRTAGSLILAISIVVWAAAYYPHNSRVVQEETQQKAKLQDEMESTPDGSPQRAEIEEKLTGLDNQIAAKYQQHSVLGAMGKTIEPVVRPLGWDWRIGCAVIASFPAREVVVATLGVVYGMGKKFDTRSEESRRVLGTRLQQAVWDGTDRPVFTLPVALSLMVFFALCAMRRDAGRNPAGDEQLALAGLRLHLYDRPGLFWGLDYLPVRNVDRAIGTPAMIENILVLLFVAAAAVYTVVHLRRVAAGQSQCVCGSKTCGAARNLAAPRAQIQPGPAATVCPCFLPRATKAAAASSVGRNKRSAVPAWIGIVAINVLHAGISRCPARQCRNCAGLFRPTRLPDTAR